MIQMIATILIVTPIVLTVFDFWLCTIISLFNGSFKVPKLAFISYDKKELEANEKRKKIKTE